MKATHFQFTTPLLVDDLSPESRPTLAFFPVKNKPAKKGKSTFSLKRFGIEF
jgi:hypothetical protein